MQHTARDRGLQITVGKDDIGGLATQFLRNALHGICGIFGDLNACARRSGKRDHIDFRVAGQRVTDGSARAMDHIEHAFGETGFLDHFSEELSRKRRHLAWLQNHSAARNQRWTDLAHDLVNRPVPRRDQHANADRLMRDDAICANIIIPRHFPHGLNRCA